MVVCQNCGHEGEYVYCPNCGHAFDIARITLTHIFTEVAHTFWHLEKGVLYTIKELAIKPGIVQKKYLAVARKKYQKPFSLFTVSGTICALSLYLIYKNAPNGTDQHFYKHYYFLVQTCMLPLYALITYLLFMSPRLNYAEVLVMNVYMLAFMSLAIVPINCLSFFLPNGIISLLEIIFLLGYNIWTFLNFFSDRHKLSTIIKTTISIILCYLLFQFTSRLVMEWFM